MPRTTGHREHGMARLVLVLLAAGAATAALVGRVLALLPAGIDRVAALPVDRAVELAVLGAGALAAAWLTLGALVGVAFVAADRLGHRWRAGEALLDRAAPAVVRRLARSAVGIGVGTGLALAPTAALAADGGETGPDSAPASVVLDLGWQPSAGAEAAPPAPATEPASEPATEPASEPSDLDAVTEAAQRAVTAAPDAATDVATPDREKSADVATPDRESSSGAEKAQAKVHEDVPVQAEGVAAQDAAPVARDVLGAAVRDAGDDGGTRIVTRGDTLWDIAAEALAGSDELTPSDADVLREMTRWHDANRDVVGDDPDLILPGQVLRTPG